MEIAEYIEGVYARTIQFHWLKKTTEVGRGGEGGKAETRITALCTVIYFSPYGSAMPSLFKQPLCG